MQPLTMALRCSLLALLGLTGLSLTGCSSPAQPRAATDDPAGVRITTTDDPSGYRGAVLAEPYRLPRVSLTDTGGRRFEFAVDPAHPVTLLFFGYTHCPDLCNTALADVASALRRMDTSLRDRIRLVFVTTDPKRDKPDEIRSYLDRFDPSFIGLTGSLPLIRRAARDLGVLLTGASPLPGGGYDVGHGAQVLGFGADGLAHLIWLPGTAVGDLRHDFTRLASAST